MKFDRSNKFDLSYYGQVNSLRLKLSVASKWASEHLWGIIYFASDGQHNKNTCIPTYCHVTHVILLANACLFLQMLRSKAVFLLILPLVFASSTKQESVDASHLSNFRTVAGNPDFGETTSESKNFKSKSSIRTAVPFFPLPEIVPSYRVNMKRVPYHDSSSINWAVRRRPKKSGAKSKANDQSWSRSFFGDSFGSFFGYGGKGHKGYNDHKGYNGKGYDNKGHKGKGKDNKNRLRGIQMVHFPRLPVPHPWPSNYGIRPQVIPKQKSVEQPTVINHINVFADSKKDSRGHIGSYPHTVYSKWFSPHRSDDFSEDPRSLPPVDTSTKYHPPPSTENIFLEPEFERSYEDRVRDAFYLRDMIDELNKRCPEGEFHCQYKYFSDHPVFDSIEGRNHLRRTQFERATMLSTLQRLLWPKIPDGSTRRSSSSSSSSPVSEEDKRRIVSAVQKFDDETLKDFINHVLFNRILREWRSRSLEIRNGGGYNRKVTKNYSGLSHDSFFKRRLRKNDKNGSSKMINGEIIIGDQNDRIITFGGGGAKIYPS